MTLFRTSALRSPCRYDFVFRYPNIDAGAFELPPVTSPSNKPFESSMSEGFTIDAIDLTG